MYTLDLPDDVKGNAVAKIDPYDAVYIDGKATLKRRDLDTPYGDRVVQKFGNSLEVDFAEVLDGKKADLVLIDAGHSYECVRPKGVTLFVLSSCTFDWIRSPQCLSAGMNTLDYLKVPLVDHRWPEPYDALSHVDGVVCHEETPSNPPTEPAARSPPPNTGEPNTGEPNMFHCNSFRAIRQSRRVDDNAATTESVRSSGPLPIISARSSAIPAARAASMSLG
jgi:hypothetical protein